MSIYDFVGHERVSLHTYFSYAADSGKDADDLSTLLWLVSSEDLVPRISAQWPLEQVATAVRRLRDGGIAGKIVLANDSLPTQVNDRGEDA